MDEEDSSDREILAENYIEGGDIETQGIWIHLYREWTCVDEDGVEQWQDTRDWSETFATDKVC